MMRDGEIKARRFRWPAIAVALSLSTLVIGFALGILCAPRVFGWIALRHHERRVEEFVNQPGPSFVGTTVDGESWSLEAQRGRVVVIDFTASWCAPCAASYPFLRSLHEKYGASERFAMVSVSLDS